MKTTTCLIIEPTDRTPDGNIRKEVFEALCNAPIVIEGTRVVKCETAMAPVAVVAAPKRNYTRKVPQTTPNAPQAPCSANAAQPDFTGHEPPSFDDVSSES